MDETKRVDRPWSVEHYGFGGTSLSRACAPAQHGVDTAGPAG